MNTEQLVAALRSAGVDEGAYRIDGQPSAKPMGEGALGLKRESGGRWVAGGLERGTFTPERHFATEDEACQFMYENLTTPQKTVQLSPAEYQASLDFTAKRIAEIERMLAERKRDKPTP
ncbi:hypothetical protein [Micromonospora sp. NPDC093277]|uniref:hypothetical protein n=1 Tax=Micromonospora sp. NPDC093277 TaxID=3364291 RepID=UPI00380FA708